MTITYSQLDHLSLTRLDHAITAWKEVVRKMKGVDESHGPKAQKPFEAAGWSTTGGSGDTAATAHRQIKDAGREADAAVQQARAIEKVLTETRDSLKAHQKRLHDYVQETTASGKVRISDQGKVTFTESVVDDPELQGQPGYGQAVAAEQLASPRSRARYARSWPRSRRSTTAPPLPCATTSATTRTASTNTPPATPRRPRNATTPPAPSAWRTRART